MRTPSEFEKLQKLLDQYKRGMMTSDEYLEFVADTVEEERKAEVTLGGQLL